MNDSELRLECLRIASASIKGWSEAYPTDRQVVETAAKFYAFVANPRDEFKQQFKAEMIKRGAVDFEWAD